MWQCPWEGGAGVVFFRGSCSMISELFMSFIYDTVFLVTMSSLLSPCPFYIGCVVDGALANAADRGSRLSVRMMCSKNEDVLPQDQV